MNQYQETSSRLPTYAEAMSAHQHDHQDTINNYRATSPSHNSPYSAAMASSPTSNPSNYSQPMPISGYQQNGFYDQQQYQQNQASHIPPTDIQPPPVIHVIRHVAVPPQKKNSHTKIILAFILGLIVIAAILRMTIRRH